jgi:hypothetical protein
MPNVNKYTEPWEGKKLPHDANGGDGARPLTPDEIVVIARPKLKRKVDLNKLTLSERHSPNHLAMRATRSVIQDLVTKKGRPV